IIIFLAAKFRLIELKDLRIIFLLSLNLVTVIVFNQQVITGRSIQPYHYLFYCANYLVTFSSFSLIYILLKEAMGLEKLRVMMVFLVSFALCVGIFDSIYSASISSSINLWRDELVPVAEKIKLISQTPEFKSEKQKGVILSFDFTNNFYFTGIDLPAITSQPVLWGPHAFYLPDVTHQKNIRLLHTLHYYQNVSKERLKADFFHGMGWEAYGYLGPAKMSKIQTGKEVSIKPEEVDIIVEDYERFFQNFSFQDAQNPVISFVLVNKKAENDFTNLDRWYQRDQGEVVGNYILYRVKLRQN
ncbi:MAG: hypothetical protein AAB336_01965, partial [Acidobacteriota bacterium]